MASPKPDPIKISELNALALAGNLAELRTHYDERLDALAKEVASQRATIAAMNTYIGQAMQQFMGGGSTEPDARIAGIEAELASIREAVRRKAG